jgi:hypothetical protein
MTEPYQSDLLQSEILQKISNAKTKKEKIDLLQKYRNDALVSLLIWNYDTSLITLIPEGEVPYTPNDAPVGTEHTRLTQEHRKFYNFLKGGNDGLQSIARERMFILMLEGLSKDEAEVVCLVKDKQLQKKYKITLNVVKEAYPDIVWGGRGS